MGKGWQKMVGNSIIRVERIQMEQNIAVVLPQQTCSQKRLMDVLMQQFSNNLVWQTKECYSAMPHFSYRWYFPFAIQSNLVFQMILKSHFSQKKKHTQICQSTKVEWVVLIGTHGLQLQQRSWSNSMESRSVMDFVVVPMVQSFADGRKEDLAMMPKLLQIWY